MTAVEQHQFTQAMPKISEIWAKISRVIHDSSADETLHLLEKENFVMESFVESKKCSFLCVRKQLPVAALIQDMRKEGGPWAAEIIFCNALSRTKRKLCV